MTSTSASTTTAGGTLVQQTIGRIERSIESGEWPVGTRLPAEGLLVSELGVGRNTVREAVRALCHTGLLEARRGDGTYVRAASDLGAALKRRLRRAELGHILQVRLALEREAAVGAAGARSEADLAAILSALVARRRVLDSGDIDVIADRDHEFHRAIVRAAGNPLLADLYESIASAVRDSIADLHPLWDEGAPGEAAHEDLADAIARGDAGAAAEAARAHAAEVAVTLERIDASGADAP
ncbi:hypothetical protein BIV57_11750 [Mangrovactinospora gilvigrisea]|uniref:HTH gntR-type domain-containing protein n=1 Tax=Mangrovactinospora gilvigrisea TaxID=1428644 RepID=A0A1J7BF52_9ACTN|nr:FCD domain-containing protein [Mangrovactinospora gilvigrisea]OIV37315.1 hypothetical protein BIV57_11750 [Mangrovactinospora gilvigrisea]